jgi:hypothetical protein
MPSHNESLESYFGKRCRQKATELQPKESPSDAVYRYRNDPVGFAKDILGIWPSKKQAEILNAILANKQVSVASGHKCGKSCIWAVIAWWFYCSFDGGRVVIMAATDRQVNGIIWKEIRKLGRKARVPLPNIKDIHISASAGITNPKDDSEIKGYTAKTPEAVAGTSGHATMYLFDEASGIDDAIFSAMDGNTAGGNSWMCLISNPTKAEGEFYRSHHTQRQTPDNPYGYYAIHMSCFDSPNITGEWKEMPEWDSDAGEWKQREAMIPGLAMPEYPPKMKAKYGEDSWDYQVRVLGLFTAAEDAKIFPRGLLHDAELRWYDDAAWIDEPAIGRLYIGVDPAGAGEGGDQSGFCARRGRKVLELFGRKGMSSAAHIVQLQGMIETHGKPGETPIICIESEGEAGWEVYNAVRDHGVKSKEWETARIRTSQKAQREPDIYHLVRDELYTNARSWMRANGAIPSHGQLGDDLHVAEFKDNAGKLKVLDKKEMKQLLNRSPDIGDAFLLSCWEPAMYRMIEDTTPAAPPIHNPYRGQMVVDSPMNPYAAMKPWG